MLSILEKYVYLQTTLPFICKKSTILPSTIITCQTFFRDFCFVMCFFDARLSALSLNQGSFCNHLGARTCPHHMDVLQGFSRICPVDAPCEPGRVIKLASLSSKHSISEKKKPIIISFDSSESPVVITKVYHSQDTLGRAVAGGRSGGAQCLSSSRGIGVQGCGSVHEARCMRQLLAPMCHLHIP